MGFVLSETCLTRIFAFSCVLKVSPRDDDRPPRAPGDLDS